MKAHNIFETKEWFGLLQTGAKSQAAVMTLDAGGASGEKLNSHEKSDQILLVIEGEVEAELEGEKQILRKGDVVIVPAGTKHRFVNCGPGKAITFNVYAPPEY